MSIEQDRLKQLIDENRRLKQRLLEIEEREAVGGARPTRVPGSETTQVTQVLRLLGQREESLEKLSSELEQTRAQLARFQTRLQAFISALSMYQQLIDVEPDPILGVNADGRLVLYNRAASRQFGESIDTWRLRPIDDADFSSLDPYIPVFTREVLKKGETATRTIDRGGRRISTAAFVMGQPPEVRGVLLRITTSRR